MSHAPSPTRSPPPRAAALPEPLRHQVETEWEQFLAASREAGLAPPHHPELLAVLRRVWACSPFVARGCIAHPELLDDLLRSGDLLIGYPPGRYRRLVGQALAGVRDEDALGRALRRLRRREMIRIAWRDLAGWAPVEETLHELSWLAEAAIDGALGCLYQWACRERGMPIGAASGAPQSLIVLGMGKLGAWELNFSSDIDLIFAYPEEGETRGRRARVSNEEFFADLGRRLIRSLSAPTEEGFVFRTDLRLRPYGQSGPLVMSFAQLEDYYQSQGREWERYALIKARPVAGDREQGRRLLAMLRPFVYRRYLDFGVFEALREMKALIDREVSRRELQDNIKLGPGGIREVEFIGQTFQLIRGGREPALQEQRLLVVLRRLAEAGHLSGQASEELIRAYCFLRRVENHLQMAADQQTHQLPATAPERLRLAVSMGCFDWEGFARELNETRQQVQAHFEQVFATSRPPTPASGAPAADYMGVWLGTLPDDQARAVLAAAGFADGAEALRRLRLLRESYACRSLSSQGRMRLDRLMPRLLGAVAEAERPDVTLVRVLDLVERIARRTAYLALLAENPQVLAQLVRLCGASPWIAALLGEQPLLLDELLDPRTLYAPLDRAALERELRGRLAGIAADDLEQQMEVLRHFKQANVLRVAAADVAGAMPLMVVSDHLTEIAEVVLAAVLELAAGHLGRRGAAGFAIVAYGKLGGIELGYGSDLDLVFLHAGAAGGEAVRGYLRLAQRVIHMLGAHTPAGVLYEVDVRLRPSGAAGLLVSAIEAFEDYQRHQAWTWEHQALVRARVVAGDPALARRFDAVRREVLARPRDPETLRAEVREMRERMRRELARHAPERFDLKQDRGGIADIEFIVQYLVLRWAHACPGLLRWTDNIRLLETLEQAGRLPPADVRCLMDAYRAYRRRIHRLALQEEPAVVDATEFRDYREAVAGIWRRVMEAPEARRA